MHFKLHIYNDSLTRSVTHTLRKIVLIPPKRDITAQWNARNTGSNSILDNEITSFWATARHIHKHIKLVNILHRAIVAAGSRCLRIRLHQVTINFWNWWSVEPVQGQRAACQLAAKKSFFLLHLRQKAFVLGRTTRQVWQDFFHWSVRHVLVYRIACLACKITTIMWLLSVIIECQHKQIF